MIYALYYILMGFLIAFIIGYLRYRTVVNDFFDKTKNSKSTLEEELKSRFNEDYLLDCNVKGIIGWTLIIWPIMLVLISIRNIIKLIEYMYSNIFGILSRLGTRKERKRNPENYV